MLKSFTALLLALSFAIPSYAAAVTGSPKARDPVRFQSAVMVSKPKALLGDSGDPRCPDSTVKCFKDVDDLLFGRRKLFQSNDLVFADSNGVNQMLTENSAVKDSKSTKTVLTDGSGTYSKPVAVSARLFNTQSDMLVTLVHNRSTRNLEWTLQGQNGQILNGTWPIEPLYSSDTSYLNAVVGDFTGDGYDEVVVFVTTFTQYGVAIVMSAVDPAIPPSDPNNKGIRFGAPRGYGNDSELFLIPQAITKVTVQGKPLVYVAGPLFYDSTCVSGGDGLALESFAVNSDLSMTILEKFQPNIPKLDGCLHDLSITSGRFSTGLHDQLALLYGMTGNYQVVPFDFDTNGNLVQGSTYDTGVPVYTAGGGWAGIAAGRFAWNGATDQAALFVSNAFNLTGINTLRMLTFDQDLNITSGQAFQAGDQANMCAQSLVAGNFDRTQTNPNPPPATLANPNLQVAIAFSDCANTLKLRIFDVEPVANNSFTISQASEYVTQTLGPFSTGQVLAAPDLQGRSLMVGEPSVITINNHNQPSVILAAPPMHADFITPFPPNDSAPPSPPKVLNISAIPHGFLTSFTLSTSNDFYADTTNNTTWSFGSQETAKGGVYAGDCDAGFCENVDVQFSAKQALDGNTANINGNFYTDSYTTKLQSALDDLVLYQSETRTIYSYPVIGRLQCPSSQPNCTDDQKTVPLVVNMAGADTIATSAAPGSTLPWYQPTWIPGNILSYPSTLSQLQAIAFPGDPDPSSMFENLGNDTRFFAGGDAADVSMEWKNGSKNGSNTSYNRNFSFDFQSSFWTQAGLGISAGGGADLDIGGSFGFSTLTDSMTTLAMTQGLAFNREGKIDDKYGYYVTPSVFGQQQPGGVVDGQPLASGVQTFGALRMGHVVDLDGCGTSCSAWSHAVYGYGQAPDLALNQPTHWQVGLAASDKGDGSCRLWGPGSSDLECVTLGFRATNRNQPADIWSSEFHMMRGLYIQGPSGTGPQVGTATTGDSLVLTARVYNLSFVEMPADTQIHVRFMAFPWNTSNSSPAGKSFMIGEQTMAPIPAFNSPGAVPNWALISQPFNTGGTNCGEQSCDNQDLVFWVAAWAVNGSGQLITEMPSHGLTSILGSTDDFFDVVAREEPYSNNLGFYDQAFHIFSKSSSTAGLNSNANGLVMTANAKANAKKREVGVRLTHMGRLPGTLRLGSRSAIAARVKTGSRELRTGLTVHFYDGHPEKNGRLFGMQTLPYLKARSRYDFRVNYRPGECGLHRIFAHAGKGTRHEHLARMRPIKVKCTKAEKEKFPPKLLSP